ncbi:MAG: hypothetical protein QF486_01960 [Candidatus Woesearchaeota archaeon]|jgi:hypothetical protein|nr:hypothetical protein [Candidatus Woesearchaeota archaeon]MDP7181021.1 hypothetical protein [Candidatus Woesearchaeota archaeon]MDP7198358.1 hypothetical protein [Candidatus Woesearchaeota archaeon]MDP7467460.1 hypothetical protein [Candidatus Woesearchaeota archaeon]MDP7647687.1 hypothetical protein [Candidatus Woesearchaeota archaeon]
MAVVIHHWPQKSLHLHELSFTFNRSQKLANLENIPQDVLEPIKEDVMSAARLGRANAGLDDNFVLHLDGFKDKHMKLSYGSFAEQEIIKRATYELKDPKDIDPLVPDYNVLSSIIYVTTQDGSSVWGFRSGGHLGERFLPIAGFCSITENARDKKLLKEGKLIGLEQQLNSPFYFHHHATGEVREEGGLKQIEEEKGRNCFGWPEFLGITGHTHHSPLSCIILHYKVDATDEEINTAYRESRNQENSFLIFLPHDQASQVAFAGQLFAGPVNPFEDIHMRGDKVVRDGEEITWGHIENGLAAHVLYNHHIFGEEAGVQTSSAIIESGHHFAYTPKN